jgi:hypothetical protein
MTSSAIAAAFLNSFAQTVCEDDPEQPIGRIREGAAVCCDDNSIKLPLSHYIVPVIAAPGPAAG